MKKPVKIILSVILIAVLGGIIWWQYNKKRIVRNQIEKAVGRGTDSTYFVSYDSSKIDELSGSAVFYNLRLQSDSLQEKLMTGDTAGVPQSIFNVKIERLSILGADIPSLLAGTRVQANTIELYKPVIKITNTGKDAPVMFTAEDTLALYQKITGKFNSISAGEIRIVDGFIAFAQERKEPNATLTGVNISLKNLKIDSTRNYDNIISYFVRDVNARVRSALLVNETGNRLLNFSDIEYNAPQRFIAVDSFKQTNLKTHAPIIALSKIRVTGLSTQAFIVNRLVKADSVATDGGLLSFVTGKSKANAESTIEIENDFFSNAWIKNISVGSTELVLTPREGSEKPTILKNLRFRAFGIDSIYNGTDVIKLIGNSNWYVAADGIRIVPKKGPYNLDIGPFAIDKGKSTLAINHVKLTPTTTWAAYTKTLKFQKDLYDFQFNNLRFGGVDVPALLNKKSFVAQTGSLQPILKIWNDRTVTPDTMSKLGTYPHQMLQQLDIPLYIGRLQLQPGLVEYTERGAISKQVGVVSFLKAGGTVTNVTNIPAYLKKNSTMTMNATGNFNGLTNITSTWRFPMLRKDGYFEIDAELTGFDAVKLNPVIEPLGVATVKSGHITSYKLKLRGDDLKSTGDVVFLYEGLKIRLLKNSGGELEKKTVLSLLANAFIKDNNTMPDPRKGDPAFKRVTTKSFFNLVWKSLFTGAKSSTR